MYKYIATIQVHSNQTGSQTQEVWFDSFDDHTALDTADLYVMDRSVRDEQYEISEVAELVSVERILSPTERLAKWAGRYRTPRPNPSSVYIFNNEVLE